MILKQLPNLAFSATLCQFEVDDQCHTRNLRIALKKKGTNIITVVTFQQLIKILSLESSSLQNLWVVKKSRYCKQLNFLLSIVEALSCQMMRLRSAVDIASGVFNV